MLGSGLFSRRFNGKATSVLAGVFSLSYSAVHAPERLCRIYGG